MTCGFKRLLVSCAALYATPAAAETLPVSGVYPAGNDAAASLGTIAVERFGGGEGEGLAIVLTDRLRDATIDGEPYFRIVPVGSPREIDAVLRGTATAEATRRDSGTREEEICVERDEDRDCIRREKREIPCRDQVVRLDATVRLVGTDGALIHAFDREEEQVHRFCRGDSPPSVEGMKRQLAARYADLLRADLAPVQRLDDVRVMETREGLSRDDGRAFREAVQLTKSNAGAACAAWSALEAGNPDNTAILFNLGLCAESRGALYEAHDYYRRVLAGDEDVDYARQGAARIEARWRANAQLEGPRSS